MDASNKTPTSFSAIHHSPVAGSWYPDDPHELRQVLASFFAHLPAQKTTNTIAAIAPHAGYVYSGQTAAFSIAALAARQPNIDRLFILAPSHSVGFRGVSIGNFDAYRTPLGDAVVDKKVVEQLRKCPLVQEIRQAHEHEHADDIQIPLLQYAFGERMPLIVPIVVGTQHESDYPIIANALLEQMGADSAVLVSSDFTHYGPNYGYVPFPNNGDTADNLKKLSQEAEQAIQSLSRKEFENHLHKTEDTICGASPIALLLEMLPRTACTFVLHADTSGAFTRNYHNSVTYVSIIFTQDGGWQTQHTTPDQSLGHEEQEALLKLARTTIEAVTNRKKPPSVETYKHLPRLSMPQSAFVTLTEQGELRGCIGSIFPEEPLLENVRRHAENAALHDHRFTPVSPDEVAQLHIEISVLTVPQRVSSWRDIHIGRDGVILKCQGYSAVFLPQVAPEQGWDVEQTLMHLSIKAGLPPNNWKSESAQFLTFQAQVFEEKESR
ncbi:TPA: hypothetical protein DDW35_05930 [Candidatus Sumerlaeota bacterium]|jgi:MEMO1 family protein|nr:hypothetical protein [Candidatus Sumerlaeota bacterium]